MLGLELDPLRAEKRALRTGKGVAWPPLRTMNKSSNFYIFEIHAVFNKFTSMNHPFWEQPIMAPFWYRQTLK